MQRDASCVDSRLHRVYGQNPVEFATLIPILKILRPAKTKFPRTETSTLQGFERLTLGVCSNVLWLQNSRKMYQGSFERMRLEIAGVAWCTISTLAIFERKSLLEALCYCSQCNVFSEQNANSQCVEPPLVSQKGLTKIVITALLTLELVFKSPMLGVYGRVRSLHWRSERRLTVETNCMSLAGLPKVIFGLLIHCISAFSSFTLLV